MFAQGERSAAYSTAGGGILCTAYQASRGVGCGGPVFGAALADLYAAHTRVPTTVAGQAEEVAYRADPRPGLWLLFLGPIPLVLWSGYRVARLRIRSPSLAAVVVTLVSLALAVFTLAHLVFANYSD